MSSTPEPPAELIGAAYNQNVETFRSLNQLMWQIPLIAMTLTGGLWFGVASAKGNFWLQLALLVMAALGNVGLAIILYRLRFIMERYLEWMRAAVPSGFVGAEGQGLESPLVVRRTFQVLLSLAATISVLLALNLINERQTAVAENQRVSATLFYDRFAEALAEDYEGLPFERVHPYLAERLSAGAPQQVLDVGAGSGRDAAWLANKNHQVTALEPSAKLLAVARRMHPNAPVTWGRDALPSLNSLGRGEHSFDVIMLSAVWMHISPSDRAKSLRRLKELLKPSGQIYLTFRTGRRSGESRAEFATSLAQLRRLAFAAGLELTQIGKRPDLLGRPGVEWITVSMSPTSVS